MPEAWDCLKLLILQKILAEYADSSANLDTKLFVFLLWFMLEFGPIYCNFHFLRHQFLQADTVPLWEIRACNHSWKRSPWIRRSKTHRWRYLNFNKQFYTKAIVSCRQPGFESVRTRWLRKKTTWMRLRQWLGVEGVVWIWTRSDQNISE